MSTASGHGSTMWQGYVAAIASLAQAMLFLLAILTVAISQIARQIDFDEQGRVTASAGKRIVSAPPPEPEEAVVAPTRMPDALVRARPAPGPASASLVPQPPEPASPAPRSAAQRYGPSQPASGRGQFQIIFPQDAQTVPAAHQPMLARQFEEVARAQPGRWRVWTRVPLDEPALKRSAYMRLLAVRSSLMASGAAGADIDVEMLEGGEADALTREMAIHVERTDSTASTNTGGAR